MAIPLDHGRAVRRMGAGCALSVHHWDRLHPWVGAALPAHRAGAPQPSAGACRHRSGLDRARIRGVDSAVFLRSLRGVPGRAVRRSVCVSTTTGASMIVIDLDHLSYADNMFRFMMHLMGGLGLYRGGFVVRAVRQARRCQPVHVRKAQRARGRQRRASTQFISKIAVAIIVVPPPS